MSPSILAESDETIELSSSPEYVWTIAPAIEHTPTLDKLRESPPEIIFVTSGTIIITKKDGYPVICPTGFHDLYKGTHLAWGESRALASSVLANMFEDATIVTLSDVPTAHADSVDQVENHEHYCDSIESFPTDKFLQLGLGVGRKILIVGEAPAPNGWRKSGRAFYTPEGKLLPTGKNLNLLLEEYKLSVETCSFTELVKCYVGKDRKLLTKCGSKCWPIFVTQLNSYAFTFLIILGVKTLELFNLYSSSALPIGEISELIIESKKYKVLPLYHPSPISPIGHKNNLEIVKRNEILLTKLLL